MSATDFIATLALITAVASLTYTMVVDRRRPRLKVRGAIVHIFDRSPVHVDRHGPYFDISATNHGPGRISVRGVGLTHRGRIKRWYRRFIKGDNVQGAVLNALPDSPNQLPMWLEVGESLTLFYPPDSDILKENEIFDCFYLHDSLGGQHWAQKGVFVEMRESLATPDRLDTEVKD